MLSFGGEDNLNNTKSTLSSSSSFSSSSPLISPTSTLTLSGPAHFEIPQPANNPTTMEEVWKDINLSSLHNHSTTGFRGAILQDFLARPFSKDQPVSVLPTIYGSPTPTTAVARPSPPPALLNLNSEPDHQLHFLGLINPDDQNTRAPISNVGPLRMPFDDVLASSTSSSFQAHNVLKSFPENGRSFGGGGGDRRHKRMIKNRESAARSRARKQAYTNELQIEVERLKEENARLRKQQQLSQAAAAADQFPKKSSLQRTSTAPF